MTECEGGQCAPGRAPNIGTWTFNGMQGQGRWRSGAIGNLTIKSFTPDDILILRRDTGGSTPGIAAIYTGKLHGNRIDGNVTWSWPGHFAKSPTGTWYATFDEPKTNTNKNSIISQARPKPSPDLPAPLPDPPVSRGPISKTMDRGMFTTLSTSDPPEVSRVSDVDAWAKAEVFEAQNKFSDALFWFERAASKGDMEAASEIGFFYQRGLGVQLNNEMAVRWYEVATAAGDMVAMRRLAVMLFRGLGVQQDLVRSDKLSQNAYNLGNSDAAFGLAMLYETGAPGVARQPALAQSWYQKAFAELDKANSVCSSEPVKRQMSEEITTMLLDLYTTPTAIVVFSVMAGTNQGGYIPGTSSDGRTVTEVSATMRHGPSEVECDTTFSVDPTMWSFRVNVFRDSKGKPKYLVRAATGKQWFQLLALRPMMRANGVRTPIGMQNLNEFDSH
jgi:hypothetical protein